MSTHEDTHEETRAKAGGRPRRRPVTAAVLAVGIAAVQLLFMFCLGYPPLHAKPHHLPIGIAGPNAAVAQVEAKLDTEKDALHIHYYSNALTAREAVLDREIYGAIVITPDGPELLVASAANPTVATALRAKAAQLSPTGHVNVADVVPAPKDDPNGSGALTTVLPLTLLSLALGTGIALLEKRPLRRLAWVALATTISAGGASWMVNAMGTFTGNYWASLGVLASLIFGIGTVSAGLTGIARVGRGLDLTFALLLLCIGIPGAGALVPPEFLAQPWRALGPLLPPGAAVDTMRGANFFDGAGTSSSAWILTMWVVVGIVLIALPTRRALAPQVSQSLTPQTSQ